MPSLSTSLDVDIGFEFEVRSSLRTIAESDSALGVGAGTNMCPTLDAVALPPSLYEEGFHEALRHKWIESQKCGRDVGAAAVIDWYRRHWLIYCRQKRLEHLWGRRSWREFDQDDFGLIESLKAQGDLLLDRILDRLHHGMENLDVILWARDWGLPMPRVLDILTELDINCARLDPAEILAGV